MICTVYTHKIGVDKIVEVLKKSISNVSVNTTGNSSKVVAETKGGLFGKGSKLLINYRERLQPDYQIHATEDCPLNENLKGLYGYINSLPTNNENVKGLCLAKVQTLNAEFSIQQEGTIKNLKEIILELAQELDALLFVQPDALISKSNGQHFLDKNLDLIIDGDGNCEIEELVVNIDSKYYDKPQTEATEDQKLRKEQNDAFIASKNIKVNKNLPFVESEDSVEIRSAKEIAERVTILAVTNFVAFNSMSGSDALEYISKYNLIDLVTPKELDFLQNPTEDKKSQETWKCECIWVLFWALDKTTEIGFPNALADLNNIPTEQYPVGKDKDPWNFINAQTSVKSTAEILNANDLYYRLDWACVDARINGLQIEEVHPGVVYERHYALNWLINYNNAQWDDVSCDT
ncbi:MULTISPECIES: DUF4272 domain-containing protein [unclassified Cellulophaga]|uniref:DUF4272 domain-containing protein n=1 Tax=unclassified Cellulophaga TaxID=2634405 RepID=UPI0026E30865|nr:MULTISPECIES: DUF4272 domain-containing protein [unclassified Cellulophaga]MDO6490982.1 DUF4272 domain-containing protein [Cellulophaga sp. 2_MG-2023]MDO6493824.1 DUF4272 domain-containing protein [Cellulophaga sp. 3_MG-2023]